MWIHSPDGGAEPPFGARQPKNRLVFLLIWIDNQSIRYSSENIILAYNLITSQPFDFIYLSTVQGWGGSDSE